MSIRSCIALIGVIAAFAFTASAQTTTFTYQGSLRDGATAANGNYDFEFALFDAVSGGNQIGSTLSRNTVAVTNGIFSVSLDFGSQFPGATRFLEIHVRLTGQPGITVLAPRQPVGSAPYSVKSLNADTATTAGNVTGTVAIANGGTGSTTQNFVDLTTTQTVAGTKTFSSDITGAANVNLSTTNAAGTVGVIKQNGFPLIHSFGTINFFAGAGAGNFTMTGSNNTAVGPSAFLKNTTGIQNAANGVEALFSNTSGSFNTASGMDALALNTTGSGNTASGSAALNFNTTGNSNIGVGEGGGQNLTTGSNNIDIGNSGVAAESSIIRIGTSQTDTFLTGIVHGTFSGSLTGNASTATNATQLGGVAANQYTLTTDPRLSDARAPTAGSANYVQNTGVQQASSNFNISGNGTAAGTLSANAINATTQFNISGARVLGVPGSNNLFAGLNAGNVNTGHDNSFFGTSAGTGNTVGSSNSFFGRSAGQSNTTSSFNSFVGAGAGQSNTTGSDNSFFGTSAGFSNTTADNNTFVGSFAGSSTTAGNNSFIGENAGFLNTTGNNNSFVGASAGLNNTTGAGNSFVGTGAGQINTTGVFNSFVGEAAGLNNTTGGGNSFVGQQAGVSNTTGSNNTIIGEGADVSSNNLSFATAIGSDAVVGTSNTIVLGRSDASDTVDVPGKLQIDTLATAGSTSLCLNSSNRVGTCSSSLRYKTNIGVFGAGLSLVRRLHPITFDWKEGGMHDLGLGAEDVAKIDPLLVTYNAKGEVEGVKYDRIGVVLVNAVNEQQKQIETQQKQNLLQQKQIEALTQALCSLKPGMKVCKPKE